MNIPLLLSSQSFGSAGIFAPTSLDVPNGQGSTTELEIDTASITWSGQVVQFEDIVSVAYCVRSETVAPFQQATVMRVNLTTPAGGLSVVLGGEATNREHPREFSVAYYALVECLYAVVEPRLRGHTMKRVERGDSVTLARNISLTTDGLLVGPPGRAPRSLVAWERLPAAQYDNADVIVSAASHHESAVIASVSMMADNAVLLPDLLSEATAMFSS